jgi:hypothetical protein
MSERAPQMSRELDQPGSLAIANCDTSVLHASAATQTSSHPYRTLCITHTDDQLSA